MIKIKVSYERPEQLREIILRLGNEVVSCRRSAQKSGERLRAYITMRDDVQTNHGEARDKQTNKVDDSWII